MKWAWFAKAGKWIALKLVKYGPTIADAVVTAKKKG